MKRFTEKRDGVNVIPLRNAVCGIDMPHWKLSKKTSLEMFLSGDAADRLAAYEETGYDPEDVAQMGAALKMQSVIVQEASELLNAKQDGRLIVLPCKIGAKVRDIFADYEFVVEKVETCVVYDKPALIFRCGNPGTSDYAAFYDFEIGTDIEIIEGVANG